MMDVVRSLREIGVGLWSLVVGMDVTFRCLFKSPVTLTYPYKTLTMTPRFRGPLELIRDANDQPRCVVCLMCQRTCPSKCIVIEGDKPEGGKRKVPTRFTYDFTTCSLCGLCVESCRFEAIRYSHAYNLAGTCKEAFVMDLLKPRAKQGEEGR